MLACSIITDLLSSRVTLFLLVEREWLVLLKVLCVCACVRACMCVCARVCVRMYVCMCVLSIQHMHRLVQNGQIALVGSGIGLLALECSLISQLSRHSSLSFHFSSQYFCSGCLFICLYI